MAEDMQGGAAPSAKRIYIKGGDLPAAADCRVQAPFQHCLIQQRGEVLAFGRLDVCDMATRCVGRPTQGSGGRLDGVRAVNVAEQGTG